MDKLILIAGVEYVNNVGKIVVPTAANTEDLESDMYQGGFDLQVEDEFFNAHGFPFSGDKRKQIVMTKEDYDVFLIHSNLSHLEFDGWTLMEVIGMLDLERQALPSLKIELGGSYINDDGIVVFIDGAWSENDEAYQMGFDFFDKQGLSYTVDGRTGLPTGNLQRVYDESQGMRLQQGGFYRNKLGKIVFITLYVDQESSLYQEGFRLMSHRGTAYTPEGSVKSRIWGQLDLVEHVKLDDITPAEMQLVHSESDVYLRTLDRRDSYNKSVSSVKRAFKKMSPFVLGSALGLGVAVATAP